MSDMGIQSEGQGGAFNPMTMFLVIGVGTLAFIAMLVLGAYAPDLRSGHNGGSHALSNAATGFSGIVRLAEETGRHPVIVRAEPDFDTEDLAVITPEDAATNLNKILDARGSRVTLVVLPKWQTAPDQSHPGWVRVTQLTYPQVPQGVLAPLVKMTISHSKGDGEPLRNLDAAMPADVRFLAPAVIQSMTGPELRPLIVTADGKAVLAKFGDLPLYILSEPDLLNNHGMGSEQQASSALALLDYLNSTGAKSILFDVTANGLGRSRSPLKLAFDAPFLAVTLTVFIAMLLAAWQALVRFGPMRRRERAIAFGKAALVDNSAALIRKAGREPHLGGRYVDVMRDRAIALFRLPPALDPQELDARLEALNPRRSFTEAANAAAGARTREELLGAARSLNQWLEEVQG